MGRLRLLVCAVVLASAAFAAGGAENQIAHTVVQWQNEGEDPHAVTFYADGTLANAKGEKKNYRWYWSDQGLTVKFYSSEFNLLPVRGAPKWLTGQSVPHAAGERPVRLRVKIVDPDGAGLTIWSQPLTDGVRPSAIEKQAAAEAHAAVTAQLCQLQADANAAGSRLEAAEAAFAAMERAELASQDRLRGRAGALDQTRVEEWKAHKRVNRRVDPAYSWSAFSRALADWGGWQSRKQNAEADLTRARADRNRATDRRVRAEADLRVAQSEYTIARLRYESAYCLAWRPEYFRRKARLKAEAAKVQAAREAAKARRQFADRPPPAEPR